MIELILVYVIAGLLLMYGIFPHVVDYLLNLEEVSKFINKGVYPVQRRDVVCMVMLVFWPIVFSAGPVYLTCLTKEEENEE